MPSTGGGVVLCRRDQAGRRDWGFPGCGCLVDDAAEQPEVNDTELVYVIGKTVTPSDSFAITRNHPDAACWSHNPLHSITSTHAIQGADVI